MPPDSSEERGLGSPLNLRKLHVVAAHGVAVRGVGAAARGRAPGAEQVQRVALVGPNDCGKSTRMDAVCKRAELTLRSTAITLLPIQSNSLPINAFLSLSDRH
jgi:ABC-type branched-subunit amino acid transport system ATPase component